MPFSPRRYIFSLLTVLTIVSAAASQQTVDPESTIVPTLVSFSGRIADYNSATSGIVVGITFSLYAEQQGDAFLWRETQNVTPDRTGRFSANLGSGSPHGLPPSLFASGEARWLGIEPAGQAEQPRILLLSVPYAMKAHDAETVGGFPPSAFLMAPPGGGKGSITTGAQDATSSRAGVTPATFNVTTTGGTVNSIPLFNSGTNIQNSILAQTGNAGMNVSGGFNVTGNLGVGTTAPAYKLEVDSGDMLVRGTKNFGANGQTANLYVGDTNHDVFATFGWGLSFSTWQQPSVLFLHDVDGHASLGYYGSYSTTAQLAVRGGDQNTTAVVGTGFSDVFQTGKYGSDGVIGVGGNGDTASAPNAGGNGVVGAGGNGGTNGGNGVTGIGGNGPVNGIGGLFQGGETFGGSYGDGIDSYAGVGTGLAGYFFGNVVATGSITGYNLSMQMDHPLDPANKYLNHSAVESSDMMNIYNGNTVTNESGDAVISLPEWFQAVNRDFRYQLTVLGQFAQAIVTSEVANNQFAIKTDKPNVKVSWQVTGIRQDAWANTHRIPVEEQKNSREAGFYVHPELYGAPEEKNIAWARHPSHLKFYQSHRAANQTEPIQ